MGCGLSENDSPLFSCVVEVWKTIYGACYVCLWTLTTGGAATQCKNNLRTARAWYIVRIGYTTRIVYMLRKWYVLRTRYTLRV